MYSEDGYIYRDYLDAFTRDNIGKMTFATTNSGNTDAANMRPGDLVKLSEKETLPKNYNDSSLKRWWSRKSFSESGVRKEIVKIFGLKAESDDLKTVSKGAKKYQWNSETNAYDEIKEEKK
jgi:hypothetical protein